MRFDPGLCIGEKITFVELRTIFQCGNAGGMLVTKKYKTLVIISDHTKMYSDRWEGSVLHYVGMGQEGDQTLSGNANQKLYESETNGFTVHLFEVFVKKEYEYRGIVKLVQAPYQEQQRDKNGNMRKVWVFPVQLVHEIEAEERVADERLLDRMNHMTVSEMDRVEFHYTGTPKRRGQPTIQNNIKVYPRSEKVSQNAIAYAGYACEIDKHHPSFVRRRNHCNYVEPHHLVPMEYSEKFDVSLDVEENIVALCSNCHNQIHYGCGYEELIETLYNKRKELLEQVGIHISLEELKDMYI